MRRVLWCLTLVIALVIAVAASRSLRGPDTVLDKLRATRRAKAFLAAIGAKPTSFEGAKLDSSDPGGTPWHREAEETVDWERVSVNVGRNTGTVYSYFDHRKPTTPGGPPAILSKEAALARAKVILAASGQTCELGSPTVWSFNTKRLGRHFSIRWPRMHGAVPYLDQIARVAAGETGQTSFDLRIDTDAKPGGSIRLERVRAVAIANACLGAGRVDGAHLASARAMVVEPNRKWRKPGSVPPLPKSQEVDALQSFPDDPDGTKAAIYRTLIEGMYTPEERAEQNLEIPIGVVPRIAWVCKYELAGPHGPRACMVWVDGESGEILGGRTWDVEAKR